MEMPGLPGQEGEASLGGWGHGRGLGAFCFVLIWGNRGKRGQCRWERVGRKQKGVRRWGALCGGNPEEHLP